MNLLIRFRHQERVCHHHLGHRCVMLQQEAGAFHLGKNKELLIANRQKVCSNYFPFDVEVSCAF
jgi:hypothetical protein